MVVLGNLVTDLVYAYIDPRIRIEMTVIGSRHCVDADLA